MRQEVWVRWILGTVTFCYFVLHAPSLSSLNLWLGLFGSVSLILGLFAPIGFLILTFSLQKLSLLPLTVAMLLLGTGRRWSIVKLPFWGEWTGHSLEAARWGGLFVYLLNGYAQIYWLLFDPRWIRGEALPLLILSPLWNPFASLLDTFSGDFIYFSCLALLSLFSLGFTFCVFTLLKVRYSFPAFVLLFAFFVLRLLFFHFETGLNWVFEFAFFFLLVHSPWRVAEKPLVRLYYDDRCNLCKNAVRMVRLLDLFQRVSIIGFSQVKQKTLLEKHADQIILEKEGKYEVGYAAYSTLARNVYPFNLFWPVFWLGNLLQVGPLFYNWVRVRRKTLFGVCTPAVLKPSANSSKAHLGSRSLLIGFLLLAFALLLPTWKLPSHRDPRIYATLLYPRIYRMKQKGLRGREIQNDTRYLLLPVSQKADRLNPLRISEQTMDYLRARGEMDYCNQRFWGFFSSQSFEPSRALTYEAEFEERQRIKDGNLWRWGAETKTKVRYQVSECLKTH